MSRGNAKRIIFEDDYDRRRFIEILREACERYGVDLLAECRMGTHYHLVVRTPRANISEFMGYLNGEYAKYSHRRYGRSGHFYNERFQPILVDSGVYLRVVLSYVLNNPVEAGLVSCAGEWQWSSYRATAGVDERPSYLWLDWFDSTFPGPSRAASQALFEQYVNAPSLEEAECHFERVVFGGDDLKQRVRAHIAATSYLADVPRAYRALHRPPLDALLSHRTKAQRNAAMLRAHVVYAYSMTEIARCLGIHPASASRIIASIRTRLRRDEQC